MDMSYRLWGLSLLCLFSFIWGCSQNRVTEIPNSSTEKEKTCVMECRQVYFRCNTACDGMLGSPETETQHKQCLKNCNEVLEDCYDTCR